MRFILRYKYGILQTKTERIDINFCQNTTQLIEYLQKRVRQPRANFIVRFKRGKNHLRIVPGWELEHYALKQGCQLNIEQVEMAKTDDRRNSHLNNKYLNNVLGFNRLRHENMDEVQEKPLEEEQEGAGDFNIRKYLDQECQRMLKEIQKKSMQGFRAVFQQIPEDVPDQYLIELKQKKLSIIDELGQKGWGAVHYAIFCGAESILDQLIALDVDINKCTSDGWLPIQLAIDIKSKQTITKLLQDLSLNLNLVTIRGSPIHTAAKLGNNEILMLLLQKQVDVSLKDHTGKTAYDVCLDQQCKSMLKKYEEKRETYNEYVRGNLPLSLTTIFRGSLMKAKRPFMNLKERYLLVDPFQGSIIRYQNKDDYPRKAKQITPLNTVRGIKIISEEEKSWHMKKQLHYFVIEEPNMEIYACKFRHIAQKWVSNLILAVKFSNELQKNSHLISEIKRNQIIIEDVQFDLTVSKDIKKKRPIFVNSLLSRNSSVSNRSQGNTKNSQVSIVQQKKYQSGIVHVSENQNANANASANANVSQSSNQKTNQKQQQALKETPISRAKAQKSQLQAFNEQFNSIATNKVNFSSFNIVKTLGSGAFGKVFLAKHISTGKLFALKALKKKNLIVQKQLKYAIVEANILKQANCHFIINLHYAFQTPHYLYLALDYCPGRDFSFHLAREVTLPQKDSCFYIAQLILAIEHLHQKKIIYRDLKPENILLDEKGNVKLADFGLSKQVGNDDKTKSFCGSPAYLSPQMLSQKGVGKESDLYGIGAVLYQFLCGEPPYFSDDIPTLYRNIREGKLKFPKNLSEVSKSLIIGLLQRDPKKRLGYNGFSQIKKHPYFNSIDWVKLSRMEIPPPQRPQLQDSQLSEDELDQKLMGINNNANKFSDFDYDQKTKKINRLANFSFVRTE